MTIRSTMDIKRGLLKTAFAEGRGPEMIAEILTRHRRSAITPEDKTAITKFDAENEMQPQGIRALNRLAEHVGLATRYSDTILLDSPSAAIN